MTRAALLPAGSDPFLLAYWLRNFSTWAEKVDELHIAVCGPLEAVAWAYIKSIVAKVKGAKVYHLKQRTDHGVVLAFLFGKTKADTIMLCEDDAFVRRPQDLDECFSVAESGGVAATRREGYGTANVGVAAAAQLGDEHSYWPCFVFVSRENLLKTDLRFGATIWDPGSMMFGYTFSSEGLADTFVWMSYQLRALGLKEFVRDNHRLTGQHIEATAPWFHVGSLSSGHGYVWMTDRSEESRQNEITAIRLVGRGDAAQRIAWWERAWKCADGAIPEYHQRYGEGLYKYRDDVGVMDREVRESQAFNDGLITWAEA